MPIEKSGAGRDKACPKCGTALSEYRKTGLVGCAHCYEVFREDILPALENYQGGVNHAGAVASQAAGARSDDTYGLVFAYNTAKAEMEQAIIRGDYAKAQSLTVRVGELHKKLFSRDKN